MPMRYLEDFPAGLSLPYGPYVITEAEIIRYARQFDMQPMHVDPVAAKHGFYGSLIASGWHTAALNMRMIADAFIGDSASMGAPGCEEVRWLKPVFPGDTLTGAAVVLANRASATKQDRGAAQFRLELKNQRGELVFSQRHWTLFFKRNPGLPDTGEGGASPSAPLAKSVLDGVKLFKPDRPVQTYFFEDLQTGATRDIGSYEFTEENIIEFARQYDPQPFHVDRQAARKNQFGGIIASGWHTGAAWMRMMLIHSSRAALDGDQPGVSQPKLGPSPGFRDMRWLKPVRPGDTLSFSSTVAGKRESSQAGFGIMLHHNTAMNQNGEKVFEFTGSVLWGKRA